MMMLEETDCEAAKVLNVGTVALVLFNYIMLALTWAMFGQF